MKYFYYFVLAHHFPKEIALYILDYVWNICDYIQKFHKQIQPKFQEKSYPKDFNDKLEFIIEDLHEHNKIYDWPYWKNEDDEMELIDTENVIFKSKTVDTITMLIGGDWQDAHYITFKLMANGNLKIIKCINYNLFHKNDLLS